MTEQEKGPMSNTEINRAIAEALDYTVMQDDSGGGWKLCHPTGLHRYPWRDSQEEAWADCDEYCNCLNAMHEAEKVLIPNQGGYHDKGLRYWGYLLNICGERYNPVVATARQRAEAFLRTVNKWRDQ